MSDSDSERDPVDVLAEEFAERCRRGETPSVGEYVERYPQLAEQLRDLLPAVAQMEQMKRRKQSAAGNGTDGPRLEQLGDYRILREVGRGGMGVVYEAVQQSLGRHVALKVLPAHALRDPKKLARFRREAQAAAALHHTNIVPVFGVGEQDGMHYYVMQFIDGDGLDRVVAGWREGPDGANRPRTAAAKNRSTDSWHGALPHPDTAPTDLGPEAVPDVPPAAKGDSPDPSRWRQIARIGAEAADALHYAHQQGVLHRDVKPGNLLLDAQGTVWVTDFGLAKFIDQEGLTSTGDVLGTLQYMAPECFEGRVDVRSDVYGLGLTLYELLTLRPPFSGPDAAQLLGSIHGHEPPPPRTLSPAIPRDLETIVLKAIARDPAQRYPTAQAVAEDLRRFLEDRPIQARRSTPVERLRRWCRRNPVVAGLTAALILVFLVGFAGVVWKWREAEAERQRAEGNEKRSLVERRRAEANEKLSLQALEEIFETLSRREVFPAFFRGPGGKGGKGGKGGAPGVLWPRPFDSEEDAALLQTVLKFYDRFAEENATNAKLQREAARAQRRVGDIQQRLGHHDKADAAYRRAAGMLEKLAADAPPSSEDRLEWAEASTKLEFRPRKPAELEETRQRLRKVLAIADESPEPRPGRRTALAALTQGKLAAVLQQQGEAAEAEAAYREAVRLRKALAGTKPPAPFAEMELVGARRALADFLVQRDRVADARDVIRESIADLQKMSAGGPGAWIRPRLLSEQYQSLAAALTRLGETALAAEATREAERHGKHLPPFGGGRPGLEKKGPS